MGTEEESMQILTISEELQRRQRAEQIARRIRQGLAECGHTEEEVLRDFAAFRRRLREDAPSP